MNNLEILDHTIVEEIKKLTHYEMARLWRFAKAGHIYFDSTLPYYKIFEERFKQLGGMTPGISKQLGGKIIKP